MEISMLLLRPAFCPRRIPHHLHFMSTSASRPTKQPRLDAPSIMSSSSSSSSFLVQLDASYPSAKVPTRGSKLAAGWDLYSAEDVVIPSHGRKVIATGIRISVPEGTYGRVAPRSGLAVKHGIDTGAGVIDADYRGLVGVVLFNFGDVDFAIKIGDRIAQLVLERIVNVEVTQVESLEETERGEGGFGHTGGFGAGVADVVDRATEAAKDVTEAVRGGMDK